MSESPPACCRRRSTQRRVPARTGAPGSRRPCASGWLEATPPFRNRTSVVSPSWFVLLRRTVTSTPSPAAASATSAHRRALTSLRRIPAMKRSPAITASRWPRSRATSSDSIPRPVAGGEDGREVCRPERPRRSPASIAGGPPVAGEDPGRPFPRPGSGRRRGGPGSTLRPLSSRRSPGPGPGRGARRGRRRGPGRQAAGRRARRRGGGAPRSMPGACSG